MIFFTDRKKIEDKYNEWLKENIGVKDCPFNVITFLEPLLDEEKVKKFLKEERN